MLFEDWWVVCGFGFCFFKQKTAYEMRISDWSSDVCSSDLLAEIVGRARSEDIVAELRLAHRGHELAQDHRFEGFGRLAQAAVAAAGQRRCRGRGHAGGGDGRRRHHKIGRASCRERVWQYV